MARKTAKQRARDKLLRYLSNPDNEWLPRVKLSTEVLGYKTTTAISNMFNADELYQIDQEALALRRKKYSGMISQVDKAMLLKALADPKAARLIYQRLEDWAPRKRTEVTGKEGGPLEINIKWPENGTLDDQSKD